MLSQLLLLEGHEVLEASTAQEGLQLADSEQPDLVIVDIGLPDMTGYELAEQLRANVLTQTMGLIAMTGYGQAEDRAQALAAGFDFHLIKPVEVDRLLAVIKRCGQTALRRKMALAVEIS